MALRANSDISSATAPSAAVAAAAVLAAKLRRVLGEQATLDWCHAQFMAEPYPGHWNHIANVLNPNARRVGVGIAQVGAKIVVVWDFTD